MKGTVKFFDQKKGYGFIYGEDGKEYHCHAQNVNGPHLPQNREEIEFEPATNSKGLYARNVIVVNQQQLSQPQPNQNPRRRDEREQCKHCGKFMMPRVTIRNNEPYKSFCPFCGKTHKEFVGNCFIATAVYGDIYAPEVVALRRFRDETLQKTQAGRFFIKWYYRVSPSIAKKLKGYPNLLRIIQVPLDALSKRYR